MRLIGMGHFYEGRRQINKRNLYGLRLFVFMAILTEASLPSLLSTLFTTGRASLSPSCDLRVHPPIFGQVVGSPVGEGD